MRLRRVQLAEITEHGGLQTRMGQCGCCTVWGWASPQLTGTWWASSMMATIFPFETLEAVVATAEARTADELPIAVGHRDGVANRHPTSRSGGAVAADGVHPGTTWPATSGRSPDKRPLDGAP